MGGWLRACASVVSVWFIVLCFYGVCCDPIPNLLREWPAHEMLDGSKKVYRSLG